MNTMRYTTELPIEKEGVSKTNLQKGILMLHILLESATMLHNLKQKTYIIIYITNIHNHINTMRYTIELHIKRMGKQNKLQKNNSIATYY